jgi:hypothetical protein
MSNFFLIRLEDQKTLTFSIKSRFGLKFISNLNHLFQRSFDKKRYANFLTLIIKSGIKCSNKLPLDNKWATIVKTANDHLKLSSDSSGSKHSYFTYIRGILSEASQQGYWLLIDEINLAPQECLDALFQVEFLFVRMRGSKNFLGSGIGEIQFQISSFRMYESSWGCQQTIFAIGNSITFYRILCS